MKWTMLDNDLHKKVRFVQAYSDLCQEYGLMFADTKQVVSIQNAWSFSHSIWSMLNEMCKDAAKFILDRKKV